MTVRSISTSVLRRELARRERGGDKLRKKHRKLTAALASIEAELTSLGLALPARRGREPSRTPGRRGSGRPKGGRRAKGGMTLLEALHKAVAVGKTVSPMEAAAAAKRAGYKTVSKTFGIQVASLLAKAPGFKKTGRGQYQRTAGSGKPGRPAKRGRRKATRKPGRPKGSKNKLSSVTAASAPASP